MNRAEYMKELAYLLQDVPDTEKEEALQYYEDYFDDAGPENEERVIAELGRPEKIAAIIREGAKNGYENQDAEYTESGYVNERYRGPQYEVVRPEHCEKKTIEGDVVEEEIPDWEDASFRSVYEDVDEEDDKAARDASWKEEEDTQEQTDGTAGKGNGPRPRRHRFNPFLWLLIILGVIVLAPFLAAAAAVFFAGVLVVVCTIGGIALSVILVAAALLVAGVIFIGVGIAKLFSFPIAGLMLGGAGLVLFAVGMFFLWLSILVCGKAIPGILHLMGNFFNFLSRKLRRGGAAA